MPTNPTPAMQLVERLYETLAEAGVDTDLWVISATFEPDGNPAYVLLCSEPHPYNDPCFTVLTGYVNPSGSTAVHHKYGELKLALAHYTQRSQEILQHACDQH